MRKFLIAAVFALVASAAHAQGAGQHPVPMNAMKPMTNAELPHYVGSWIYNPDGALIGSLERLLGPGEAVVHVSTYFMGGNKFVVVPADKLGVANGRVVLHDITLEALKRLPEARRG